MIKKSKIHFLTFGDIPFDQRMQRIWTSLHTSGYEIHILARDLGNFNTGQYPFHIRRFKPLFKTGFMAYAEYNIRALIYIMTRKINILCCIDLDTMPAGSLMKMISGYKLVYDAHEYYTESPEITNRLLLKRFWTWIASITIPDADVCYTVSNSIAGEMSKVYGKTFGLIRNLPYVINRPDVNVLENNPPKYILYQGALNVGRGLEHLILTMKHFPELELWLAGDGDLKDELIDLTKSNNLSIQVKFLGNIEPVKLNKLTNDAWSGINLLENIGKSYYWSLANKFFDYIQCGIPQICIDFPEYRLLNETYHVALLVPDTEVLSIKAALDLLISDIELYKKLKLNTLKAARDLNWEKEELKLIDTYKYL